MAFDKINNLIDKVIGKEGPLRVSAYWMRKILNAFIEKYEEIYKSFSDLETSTKKKVDEALSTITGFESKLEYNYPIVEFTGINDWSFALKVESNKRYECNNEIAETRFVIDFSDFLKKPCHCQCVFMARKNILILPSLRYYRVLRISGCGINHTGRYIADIRSLEDGNIYIDIQPYDIPMAYMELTVPSGEVYDMSINYYDTSNGPCNSTVYIDGQLVEDDSRNYNVTLQAGKHSFLIIRSDNMRLFYPKLNDRDYEYSADLLLLQGNVGEPYRGTPTIKNLYVGSKNTIFKVDYYKVTSTFLPEGITEKQKGGGDLYCFGDKDNKVEYIMLPLTGNGIVDMSSYCYNFKEVYVPEGIREIYGRSVIINGRVILPSTIKNLNADFAYITFKSMDLLFNTKVDWWNTEGIDVAGKVYDSNTLLEIPTTHTLFKDQFYGCRVFKGFDFSKFESVPDANNAFNNISGIFVVPDTLYDEWVAHPSWETYSYNIVKLSDYNTGNYED